MNRVISDTAEYGCYLFDHAARPMLTDFMKQVDLSVIGNNFNEGKDGSVDNKTIIEVNKQIRQHPIEHVGAVLRRAMQQMKARQTAGR